MPNQRRKRGVGNPLFVKLLEELRDEAKAEKNINAYYNYCKAVRTLKNIPFEMDFASCCAKLPFFGNYTTYKFKEKLDEYYETRMDGGYDWSDPDDPAPILPLEMSPAKRMRNTQSGSVGNTSVRNTSTPCTPKQKKSYVPKKGTGAYAILITMLLERERPDYRGYSLKNELIQKGQCLANNSMTTSTSADPIRRSYTAFNGMRTLQTNELVFTINSRPIRYKLSEKGVELARKLLNERNNSQSKSRATTTPHSSRTKQQVRSSSCATSLFNTTRQNYKLFDILEDFDDENNSFRDFCVIDDIPKTVSSAFRSKPSTSFTSPSKFATSAESSNNSYNDLSYYCAEDDDGFCVTDETEDFGSSPQIASSLAKCSLKTFEGGNPSDFRLDDDWVIDISDSSSATETIGRPESSSTDYQNANNDFEQLIFERGTFEILLVIDDKETKGGSKYASKFIPETIQELSGFGTNFVVRHLELGDFLWVARNTETGRELVLPYIIERKRMDDLAESIRDGRYQEQKFRLRKCGLPNVIYLVEKFGDDDGIFGMPATYLRQAVLNTQVVDNFFIKTTNHHRQSMCYLAALTKLLANIFQDKILYNSARSDSPPAFDTNEEMVPLITYEEFSSCSRKNKNFRIKDLFMKQLLQLNGMSVQKAYAIVQKYDTPRSLKQAFLSCNEPETMISNLELENAQTFSASLSRSIYQLYNNRNLL